MLLELAGSGVFASDPFVLVDVGCSGGLDPAWRFFGASLHAHAFDPQIAEIERLAREEENPNVRYHAAFVGLPGEPPPPVDDPLFNPFGRTSAMQAVQHVAACDDVSVLETTDWTVQELSTARVGLADFLRDGGVTSIDFVKTDTDGSDLQVLRSVEEMIQPARVLGFMVETFYTGSDSEMANSFHNVDRLLKRHGFLLADLSVNRYSRAALPAPFVYPILAETIWGQPMWGDFVYLREGAHPDHVRFGELSETKLLKLACLYELFSVPDCAAEILVAHRERLTKLIDIDCLLDLLTPKLNGRSLGYREYLAAFQHDSTRFGPAPSLAQRGRSILAHLQLALKR